MSTESVLKEVQEERVRQDARFGEQNHPNGTGGDIAEADAELFRYLCEFATRLGKLTFRDILHEEVAEAFAESDPVKLRTELLQVAAVACSWVEAIDRRGGK